MMVMNVKSESLGQEVTDSPIVTDEYVIKGCGAMKMDDAWEGIICQAYFLTEPFTWITARLSYGSFKPVFRRHSVQDAPPLDVSHIKRIGFMIADNRAGPFSLEIA
jgi:hypothetical protein